MAVVSDWTYVVPSYSTSPWWEKRTRPLTRTDLHWPRIGVYCPHAPAPWLLGSFVVSAIVLKQRGELDWTWQRDFATGDGHLIRLGERSGRTGPQLLVDDRPHDPDAQRDELMHARAVGADVGPILDRMRHADEHLRSRVELQCGTCGLARAFRSDTVQQIATRLHLAGVREVTLGALARRVDQAATQSRC